MSDYEDALAAEITRTVATRITPLVMEMIRDAVRREREDIAWEIDHVSPETPLWKLAGTIRERK